MKVCKIKGCGPAQKLILAELWEVIGDLAPDLILHNVGEP